MFKWPGITDRTGPVSPIRVARYRPIYASATEREAMFLKLDKEGHNRHEIGESLLLILDKINNYDKARLLGVLLKSLSKSIIEYGTYERFCSVLDSVFIGDIYSLNSYTTERKSPTAWSLESHGLIHKKNLVMLAEYPEYIYTLSPLGRLLCNALEIP